MTIMDIIRDEKLTDAYIIGRNDGINICNEEINEKMIDILAKKCEQYGVACVEAYSEAYTDLEIWIAKRIMEGEE